MHANLFLSMEYNFSEIEKKWQKAWEENGVYTVSNESDKPHYYVLDMFPYPSGAGLHVGHPLGYIASDIYSRYKRLKGFNVLHPMGFDSYGLPAEQYAIQTGQHPEKTTFENIDRYIEQLKKIGFCYDWNREVRTCDPKFYKWTQWAFVQMFNSYFDPKSQKAQPISKLIAEFEANDPKWATLSEREKQEKLMNYRIAYLADTKVNWCPKLGTVLANDEVSEGLSVRGGYPVEQRVMRQWCLRVSAYAGRLLEGLDRIDWTESLKETQRNWIGRSEGAEMQFNIKKPTPDPSLKGGENGQPIFIKTKIKELHTFSGMGHVKTDVVKNGDICALIGIDGFEIGDTICDAENPEPLKPIAIDEPTMSMTFCINDSPFFGQDGKFVTSRHIQDRLNKELEKNLALRVEKGAEESSWRVFGRGVLHLSVLIETMRREGYELQVGQPQVIIKEIDGVKCEPVESLTVNTPEECSGKIIEFVSTHKGEMTKMEMVNDRVHLEFIIPSRGIMGMRTYVMNVSAGEAIMAHRFLEYQPWKGEIVKRNNGSLIAMEAGTAYAYALDKLQDRGKFFIDPQEEVYAGQVVGENAKEGDIVINVTKSKKLTNMRSKSADDKAVLPPPVRMSLEEALEYIKEDEYVEVTPHAMRIRKIILDELERKRAGRA